MTLDDVRINIEIAADILNGIDGNEQVDIAQQYLSDILEAFDKGEVA